MAIFALAVVAVLLGVALGITLFIIQARQKDQDARLERLQQKVDLLLRYSEIEDNPPAPILPTYGAPDRPPTNGNLTAEIISLLAKGQKIEAIKRYREYTGSALKEAIDAVEAIDRRQRG